MLGECKQKRTLYTLLVGYELVRLLWIQYISQNLKAELQYVQLFNSTYHRDTYASVFTTALFTVGKWWIQLVCPLMDNENIYAHNVVFFSARKKWNYVICRKIDVTIHKHIKQIKSVSERQISCFLSLVDVRFHIGI